MRFVGVDGLSALCGATPAEVKAAVYCGALTPERHSGLGWRWSLEGIEAARLILSRGKGAPLVESEGAGWAIHTRLYVPMARDDGGALVRPLAAVWVESVALRSNRLLRRLDDCLVDLFRAPRRELEAIAVGAGRAGRAGSRRELLEFIAAEIDRRSQHEVNPSALERVQLACDRDEASRPAPAPWNPPPHWIDLR